MAVFDLVAIVLTKIYSVVPHLVLQKYQWQVMAYLIAYHNAAGHDDVWVVTGIFRCLIRYKLYIQTPKRHVDNDTFNSVHHF